MGRLFRSVRALLIVALMACLVDIVQAQETKLSINGKVLDETGMPLAGANIVEEGTDNGVVTDFEGEFTLQGHTDSFIEVSFVGYQTKRIKASTNPLQIQLEPDSDALDEVVLIGYGSSKNRDITGSIAAADMNAIQSQPTSNIGDALQGKLPGVQVISSGKPGDNPTIRIRGIGTIGNNDPLVVVDGMPVNGGLNQVNMRDVESLQVLKDASATAIYGSRGANGVVLIKTKGGEKSGGEIKVEAFTGIQNSTQRVNVLNAEQFVELNNDMLGNAGRTLNPEFSNPSSFGPGTDWLGALFTTGHQNDITVSYGNSGENTSIYTSFDAFNQKGIIINNDYQRYNFQLNTKTNINENIRFGNNLKLNYDIKKNGENNITDAIYSLPTQPIYRENGDFSGPRGEPLYYGDIENPIGKSEIVDNSTKGFNLHGSVFGEVDFLRNFNFRSQFGVEANLWNGRTWAPAFEWDTHISNDAFLSEDSNRSTTVLWDNILTYENEFDEDHKLTVMLGTSAERNKFHTVNGSIQDFPSETTQQLDNGTNKMRTGGNSSEWSLFSLFARATYDFQGKYLLNVSVRRDGSSRFGEGNKYGVFPAGSFAWRISDEKFFDNINFVNDLKFRLGYGITGNQEIGNYGFASQYNTNLYNFNDHIVSAIMPTVLPNPNLQWESQEQYNLGVDVSLFKSRIDLSLDFYQKNTKDMLVPQSVTVTSGYSDTDVPDINAGEMRNLGFEAQLVTHNISGRDFGWTTSLMFSYNKNKVININSDTPLTTGSIGLNYNLARIQPGYPVNVFYGFMTDGVFQTPEEVESAAVQVSGTDPATSTAPGDIRFRDLNNDGVIDDSDRTFIGKPNPDYIFSMGNTFSYKNFDLTVFLDGVYGNDILNANRIQSESMSVTRNQIKSTLDRWTGAGTSDHMPRAIYGDPNNNTRPSDRYIEDGSYLRLKNINLSYNLPVNKLSIDFLKSAQIYFSAQNLYTWTKYSGFDPEVGTNGIDNNNYPMTRTFILGLNVSF